ncbi:MAG TPA: hypothetical protein PLM00_04595 [Spirochaetota bacterium]|nr:hypothetical protein [Spirochaetota bacterium]HPH03028.1 hypothetical protein [Spirochaetota bacterium]HPN82645.1 hypothetical protein [Spirochaetota bacterium]
MSRGVLGVVLVGVAVLGLVAAGGSEWSNAQYKCAFRLPDDQWKNTTEEKMGILKDGIVEFMSLSDFSVVSLTPYAFATGEQWKSEMTLKTVETTESMIRALSDRVWLIREDPRYVVNGVSGYKREIGFQMNGIDYTAIIVVLSKNNTHYRLLFTSLEKFYGSSFQNFLRIVGTFKITG